MRGFLTMLRNSRGVTAVEYGLIAAMIAAVLIVAVPYVAGGLQTAFNNVGSNMITSPKSTTTQTAVGATGS